MGEPVEGGTGARSRFRSAFTTDRWKTIYKQRGCVERGFGRPKHEWGMLPLRVRRIERVRLHVDLSILAELATALEGARSMAQAA